MSLNRILYDLEQSAKFGAAVTNGYRRVYIKVAGSNNSWTTWTPSGVLANVSQALINNGIGFESIHDNHAFSIDPFYFEFTIVVISPNDQSNDVVLNLVSQSVNSVLNGSRVSLLSSETANDWSISNIVSNPFGNNPTGVKTIAGVSVTTAIILGIGLVAILALKGSNPIAIVRSYRK